ncbi:MAG: acetyl-CoA carboxylase biotin carboxylase subunit [Candidatus Kariarchaeaceae archaeon]|jgi:acetyl/propionyl-CoA carboxylase alpha subunit
MFGKVLVANRGEIALRIISTLQDHGIHAVVTASDPDLNSIPARQADEILHLKGETATDTYLDIDAIVSRSKELGVDAVHPGYGFLAENTKFAAAVEKAGMVFIGPSPEQMAQLGDKITSREIAMQSGTPLITGTSGELSDDELKKKAKEIGFPILIKASAGGGGRGIRLVRNMKEWDMQLENARKEAVLAFSDDRLFIEKFVSNGRHIEVQVIGLGNGEVIHFGERDCSMQRKNQKLIEEAPAPTISREKAAEIHEAAINLTSEINYRNAGTVEFLLDRDTQNFYFLEVNTRIQVEHPVTEYVTGEDLIWRQVQVAAGMDLDLHQQDIRMKGHAIEARIYAENPYKNFVPSPGNVRKIKHPIGSGVRVDSATEDGTIITPYYDPMISKLIVHAHNREAATRKLSAALNNYLIAGVHTTAAYIRDLINHPDFLDNNYHTKYLDDYHQPIPEEVLAIARGIAAGTGTRTKMQELESGISKWRTSSWPQGGWKK